MEERLIFGRYRLLRKIGSGGMGEDFTALDLQSNEDVVIKISHFKDEDWDNVEKNRFLSEASILASLDHPGIPRVWDCCREGEDYYYIMEYVKGTPLSKLHNISIEQALGIFYDVAGILSHIHSRSVVHRDIKPGNLIVLDSPDIKTGIRVKLIDFGLAKNVVNGRITSTGMVVGTFNYMAPEQLMGGAIDMRADLYSFGATMYNTLTESLPFGSPDPKKIAYQLINASCDPPSHFNSNIPEELDNVILCLLRKDPNERIQSASELLSLMQSITIDEKSNKPAGLILCEPDMVGREFEMQYLIDSWNSSQTQPVTVCVAGPFGIGKTRFVDEFASIVQLSGKILLRARGHGSTNSLPMDGLKQLAFHLAHYNLDQYSGLIEQNSKELGFFSQQLCKSKKKSTQPFPNQGVCSFAFLKFLKTISFEMPIVIILEDIEHLDKETLDVCFELSSNPELKIMVVFTCLEPTFRSNAAIGLKLHRMSDLRFIDLKNLKKSNVKMMMESMLRGHEVPNDFLNDLWERFGGVPYLLINNIRTFVSQKVFALDNGRLVYKKPVSFEDVSGSILSQHLSSLSQISIKILEFACLFEEPFEMEIVMKSLGLTRRQCVNAFYELISSSLLKQRSGFYKSTYEFAYPSMKETVKSRIPDTKKHETHKLIAQVLEFSDEITDEIACQIAKHYKMAGETDKAVIWAEECAKRLIALGSQTYSEWIDYIHGVGVSESNPVYEVKAKRVLSDIFYAKGDFEKAKALFLEALGQAKKIGANTEYSLILIHYLKFLFEIGEYSELQKISSKEAKTPTFMDMPSERFVVLEYLALSLKENSCFSEAEDVARELLYLAQCSLSDKVTEGKTVLFSCLLGGMKMDDASEMAKEIESEIAELNSDVAERHAIEFALFEYNMGNYGKTIEMLNDIDKNSLTFRGKTKSAMLKSKSFYALGKFEEAIEGINKLSIQDGAEMGRVELEKLAYKSLFITLTNGWEKSGPRTERLIGLAEFQECEACKILPYEVYCYWLSKQKRFDDAMEYFARAWTISCNMGIEEYILGCAYWGVSILSYKKVIAKYPSIASLIIDENDLFGSYAQKYEHAVVAGFVHLYRAEKDFREFDHAIRWFVHARELALQKGNKIYMALSAFNLGKAYCERNNSKHKRPSDAEDAEKFFFESEFVFSAMNAPATVDVVREYQEKHLKRATQ